MFNTLVETAVIEKTITALRKNGIIAEYVKNATEAKAKVLSLIPEGAEVMTMTSVTLDTIGLSHEINSSGKFNSARAVLMDEKASLREKKRIGAAPEYVVGSVHAVTTQGEVFIASNTGSQLPAYAYGADTVIWVVGAQKIVHDKEMAMKRIYEYVLPLESERAKKAYGVAGSAVNKMLTVGHENQEGRIHIVFVGEVLGF